MSDDRRARNRAAQRRCRARKRAAGWTAPTTTRPPTPAARRVYNARSYARRKVRLWLSLF